MKIIKISVYAAFEDCVEQSANEVAHACFGAVSYGLEAAVCYTEVVAEKTIDYPDMNYSCDNSEEWDEHARTELELLDIAL